MYKQHIVQQFAGKRPFNLKTQLKNLIFGGDKPQVICEDPATFTRVMSTFTQHEKCVSVLKTVIPRWGLGTRLIYASWWDCFCIPLCLGQAWQEPHWCSEEDKSPPITDLCPGLPPLPGACLQDSQVRWFYPDSPWLHQLYIWFGSHYNFSLCSNHEWVAYLCISHVLIMVLHKHQHVLTY